jgi:hypothetical protein
MAEFVETMMLARLITTGDMLGVMQRCIMVQQRACEGGAYGYNSNCRCKIRQTKARKHKKIIEDEARFFSMV